MSLSVIIIAKDAEATIRRCLESVAWADEIVVVESGSSDRTADICREMGAKVHQPPDWPGFGPQKNFALSLAQGIDVTRFQNRKALLGEINQQQRRMDDLAASQRMSDDQQLAFSILMGNCIVIMLHWQKLATLKP